MRTPAETLQRLAEVAPKEWGVNYNKDVDCLRLQGAFIVRALCGDIANAHFTAWCKKQLDEKGFSTYTIAHIPGCVSVEAVGDDGCIHSVSARPTEWQAVAECLISVLERENE